MYIRHCKQIVMTRRTQTYIQTDHFFPFTPILLNNGQIMFSRPLIDMKHFFPQTKTNKPLPFVVNRNFFSVTQDGLIPSSHQSVTMFWYKLKSTHVYLVRKLSLIWGLSVLCIQCLVVSFHWYFKDIYAIDNHSFWIAVYPKKVCDLISCYAIL